MILQVKDQDVLWVRVVLLMANPSVQRPETKLPAELGRATVVSVLVRPVPGQKIAERNKL